MDTPRRYTRPAAYARHPERFVRQHPQPPLLPTNVWINEQQEQPST
jgi:hypothetical protein